MGSPRLLQLDMHSACYTHGDQFRAPVSRKLDERFSGIERSIRIIVCSLRLYSLDSTCMQKYVSPIRMYRTIIYVILIFTVI